MKRATAIERIADELRKRGALVEDAARAGERWSVNIAYPRLFVELISRYSFRAFEIGGVRIYSNLKGEEHNLERLLEDKGLTSTLVGAGLMPFGRPATGSYDRVCFDLRENRRRIDAPIVNMDHEAILSFERLRHPQLLHAGLLPLFGV